MSPLEQVSFCALALSLFLAPLIIWSLDFNLFLAFSLFLAFRLFLAFSLSLAFRLSLAFSLSLAPRRNN